MPRYKGLVKKGKLWRWYIDWHGHRYHLQGHGFPSAELATRDRARFLRELQMGHTGARDAGTIAHYCSIYLHEYGMQRWRESTIIIRKGMMDNYIIPRLGDIQIDQLRTVHIESFQNSLARDVSPSVAYHTSVLLRSILNFTVSRGDLLRNPAKGCVPLPRYETKPRIVLSENDIRNLLAAAGENLRDEVIIRLCAFCGLRRAETAGVEWQDIDFQNSLLKVQRQFSKGKATPPKTRQSQREIPLDPETLRKLKELKLQSQGTEYVLATRSKRLEMAYWARSNWPKFLKQAGLPRSTPMHSMRHFFGSYLMMQGVPVKVISDLMGHGSIAITVDLYGHSELRHKREAVQKFISLSVPIQVTTQHST